MNKSSHFELSDFSSMGALRDPLRFLCIPYLIFFLGMPVFFCWKSDAYLFRLNFALSLILSLYFIYDKRKAIFQNRLFLLSVLLTGLSAISYLLSPPNGLGPYTPFLAFGLAYYLSRRITRSAYRVVCGFFYLYSAIYFVFLFRGVNPNINFFGFSENSVTIQLMLLFTLSQLFEQMTSSLSKNWTNTILMASLFFALSVWCNGRASILLSALILTSALVLPLWNQRRSLKRAWPQALSVLGISLFLLNPIQQQKIYHMPDRAQCCALKKMFFGRINDKALLVPGDFDYFTSHQFISPRFSFWKHYFTDMNLKSFFLGNTRTTDPILLHDYPAGNYNFHNSFIHMHQRYGLAGFLIYLGLIMASLLSCFRAKSRWLAFVMSCLMLRAFNDTFLFNHNVDFIVWIFFLYTLQPVDHPKQVTKLTHQCTEKVKPPVQA